MRKTVVVDNIGCQEKEVTPQKNPLVRAREKLYLRRWASDGEGSDSHSGLADRPPQ